MSKQSKKLVKVAVASDAEAAWQFKARVQTKEDVRAETDVLFNRAKETRQKDRSKMEKLFVQTPGSDTMAPNLQPEPPPTEHDEYGPKFGQSVKVAEKKIVKKATMIKEAEVVKNTAAFFEKCASGLTEAQRRFPELLKVSNATGPIPRPSTVQPKKATPVSGGGSLPVKSPLSGGSA